jgi:hypothetical protein
MKKTKSQEVYGKVTKILLFDGHRFMKETKSQEVQR